MTRIYHSHTHQRRSIRLKGYDYSQAGADFVTICAWQRECRFGYMVQKLDKAIEVNLRQTGWLRQAILKQAFEGRLG